jgi:putative FmdB family regulatory protein
MPIYEFSCAKCRMIFSFLSKRLNPDRLPVCPKCGSPKMEKQLSSFATPKGAKEPAAAGGGGPDGPEEGGPEMDDPRMMRAMAEIERDMDHLDENNPKHMAHIMKKMKDAMPPGSMPKEMDEAIRRLEKGEDPEKIEADMGDVLGAAMGGPAEEDDMSGFAGPSSYSRDSTLHDY